MILPATGEGGLSDGDLQRFCEFLYARTGISYTEAKRYFIERRLAERMERVGSASLAAYMTLLRGDGDETERMINSFTVNETYFYRETNHLRCLVEALLPEIAGRRGPGDPLRLWSVPCATGEEPYSIAIWLLENWPLVDAYNVEIVGSDIDTDVLRRATDGDYGERALARLPPELVRRYFSAALGRQRRIIADLRESVRFTRVNLIDAASVASQGRFDVIFCRNLLIYFDEASRALAGRHIHDALNPGGFVCLGHSESMARVSGLFEARRFGDTIVHRRPLS